MKVIVTEYLAIDLEREVWKCRRCAHELGDARVPYKRHTRVYARDPRQIHRPILDPERYELTFAPDPKTCVILEYYCPGCAALIEAEYTVPGAPPLLDIELDIDALKRQWEGRPELQEPAGGELAPEAVGHVCAH